MSKRSVSLSSELHLLVHATQATRILVERWCESPGRGDAFGFDELPHAVSAALVILTERIRLLDRVVRGTIDPRLVRCAQNEALPREASDEQDVRLSDWSPRQSARHHRAAWKRSRRAAKTASPQEPEDTAR